MKICFFDYPKYYPKEGIINEWNTGRFGAEKWKHYYG
jgi:hypothetical protein